MNYPLLLKLIHELQTGRRLVLSGCSDLLMVENKTDRKENKLIM